VWSDMVSWSDATAVASCTQRMMLTISFKDRLVCHSYMENRNVYGIFEQFVPYNFSDYGSLSCRCLQQLNVRYSASLLANSITEALRLARVFKGSHSFTSHEWNEPYPPLPFQPKPVLIYRPRRDRRLSWPRHHHGEQAVCSGPLRYGSHSYQLLRPSRLTGQLETQQAMSVELATSRAKSRDTNC